MAKIIMMAVVVCLGLSISGQVAQADQNDPRLGVLFKVLKAQVDVQKIQKTEAQIW